MKYTPETKKELKALCDDLTISLKDIDTSKITDMSELFYSSKRDNFDGIENWDVSNVTNMRMMFFHTAFNGDLSAWNVAKVEDISYMFSECRDFVGSFISEWDFSSLKYADYAFDATALDTDLSEVKTPNLISANFLLSGCSNESTIESLARNHKAFGKNIFMDVFHNCMTEFKKIVPELIASKTKATFPYILMDFKESNLQFEPHDGMLLVNFGKKCIGLLDQESEDDICKFLNFIAGEVSESLKDLVPGLNPEFKFASVYYDEALVDDDLKLTSDYDKNITLGHKDSEIQFVTEPQYKNSPEPRWTRIPNDVKYSYDLNFDGRLYGLNNYLEETLEQSKKDLTDLGINPSKKTMECFEEDCYKELNYQLENFTYKDVFNYDLPHAFNKSGLSDKVAIGHRKGKDWYALPLYKQVGGNVYNPENGDEYEIFQVDRLNKDEIRQIEQILTDSKNGIYETCVRETLSKYEDELQDLEQFKEDHPEIELSQRDNTREETASKTIHM